jgi:hypothetical protein
MTRDQDMLVARLHEVLVDEIRARRPADLGAPFTIAEIYQELVPYRTHRDTIGAAMNGDYEHALLRLLAGEGGYLILDSEAARKKLEDELTSPNPNTGVFRDFAALDVRLNPMYVPTEIFPPEVERATPVVFVAEAAEAVAAPARAPAASLLDLVGEIDGPIRAAPQPPPRPVPPPIPTPVATAPAPEVQAQKPPEAEEPARAMQPNPTSAANSDPKPAVLDTAAASRPTTCLWCRAELPQRESLRYCPFCGTDVKLVPCSACGEELEPEWRFCIACGTEVSSED